MSKETAEWLNTQTLIGFTDKRGHAWHYRKQLQGDEPNHYTEDIPVDDVLRRLFHWEPVEVPAEVTFMDENGVGTATSAGKKFIIRPDTGELFGMFSNAYAPHSYREWLIQNVHDIMDDSDMFIGSAGLLRGGAQAWVQFELPENRTYGEVERRDFLTAVSSLDGSLSTSYITGSQVCVCDNTMSAALRSKVTSFRVKHSKYSHMKLGEAREALGVMAGFADEFDQAVQDLLAEKVSESRFDRFADKWAGIEPNKEGRAKTMSERKRDQLTALWRNDERVDPWRGTAWGVMTAVNTWAQHGKEIRGADRLTRNVEFMIKGEHESTDSDTLALLATV